MKRVVRENPDADELVPKPEVDEMDTDDCEAAPQPEVVDDRWLDRLRADLGRGLTSAGSDVNLFSACFLKARCSARCKAAPGSRLECCARGLGCELGCAVGLTLLRSRGSD